MSLPAGQTLDADFRSHLLPAPLVLSEKLLARNTVLNLAGQFLPLLIALAALPPLMHGLGNERFGVLGVSWMLLAYFAEFGFGRSSTRFVAEILGGGDRGRLRSVVWGTAAMQAVFGVLAGALLFLGAEPLARLFGIASALAPQAVTAFRVIALSLPLVLAAAAFRGVLEGAQRFDLVNAVRVPAISTLFLLPLLGLWLGWDLPGMMALILTSRVLLLVATFVLAAREIPELRRFEIRRQELGSVAAFGGWLTVSGTISPVLVYGDRFMLGAIAGMGAVGAYTAPFELVTRLWLIPAGLVATLFPAFSTLAGRRDAAALVSLVWRALQLLLLVLTVPVVIFIALSGDILLLWLGGDAALHGRVAMQLLAVGVFANSLALVPSALLQGSGRADITARLHVIELPIHLLVSWIMIVQFGIAGAAVAWTLRAVLDAALLFHVSARLGLLCGSAVRSAVARLGVWSAVFCLGGFAAGSLADNSMRAFLTLLMVLAFALVVWRGRFGRGLLALSVQPAAG
jgi:O-antigen/teichoic acid export membrane protein